MDVTATNDFVATFLQQALDRADANEVTQLLSELARRGPGVALVAADTLATRRLVQVFGGVGRFPRAAQADRPTLTVLTPELAIEGAGRAGLPCLAPLPALVTPRQRHVVVVTARGWYGARFATEVAVDLTVGDA